MADPRVATCLFCDDIRQEVGNKLSAVGIYGTDMVIPLSPPVLIPRLAVFVSVIVDVGDEPETIVASLLAPPDRTELGRLESKRPDDLGEVGKDATKRIIRAILICAPFHVAEAGDLEVMVDMDGKRVRAGTLAIRFEPPNSPAEEAPAT